jgi:trk system potassium uptake protein TrkA
MRVVITGAGAVGRHLAADLGQRGHQVTLIEQDPATVRKAEGWAPGVELLLGDGCEPWVLKKANVASADVVVAATGDDEDNLVTSLLSKQEFAVPRVLARVALVEMTLPEDSPNAGRPIYELRLPPDSAIVAILRDGHVVIPQPETVIARGDEIVALASPDAEAAIRQAIVGDVEGGTPGAELGGAGII